MQPPGFIVLHGTPGLVTCWNLCLLMSWRRSPSISWVRDASVPLRCGMIALRMDRMQISCSASRRAPCSPWGAAPLRYGARREAKRVGAWSGMHSRTLLTAKAWRP